MIAGFLYYVLVMYLYNVLCMCMCILLCISSSLAHEYEKEFDQYEDIDSEALAPPEAATPTCDDKTESNGNLIL